MSRSMVDIQFIHRNIKEKKITNISEYISAD